MENIVPFRDRRTTVDVVFEHLYEEISAMRLRPGDKISEAEIAAQFSVSRQPVRDAFSRLGNLGLLLIRPQRATEVRGFSRREVTKSRFVRVSIEAEVLRRAADLCDADGERRLRDCLATQEATVAAGDHGAFHALDMEFHKALCEIAQVDFAFEVIQREKAKVDRLCLLSLSKENRMPMLVDDHRAIATCVAAHDAEGAVTAGMLHLSRLDDTITAISETHQNFFED